MDQHEEEDKQMASGLPFAQTAGRQGTLALPVLRRQLTTDEDESDDSHDDEDIGEQTAEEIEEAMRRKRGHGSAWERQDRLSSRNGKQAWRCLRAVRPLWRIQLFFKIPRVTFLLRVMFSLMFVFLFAYSRVGVPGSPRLWMRYNGVLPGPDLNETRVLDVVIWFWSTMLLLEEFRPLLLVYDGWSREDLWRDFKGEWLKNLRTIVTQLMLFMTTSLRVIIFVVYVDGADWNLTFSAIQYATHRSPACRTDEPHCSLVCDAPTRSPSYTARCARALAGSSTRSILLP